MRKLKVMPRDNTPASAPSTIDTAQQVRAELEAHSEEFATAITKLRQAIANVEGRVQADRP
jgi:hypothetical protein